MLPLVVKNLLIINGLFFLTTLVSETQFNFDLADYLGLHYPLAESFRPWQLVSYMFMHGNFMHLFFNMFALWMFGNTLENYWGPKRFLIYYMATGIGAGIIQLIVTHFRLMSLYSQISADDLNFVINQGAEIVQRNEHFKDPILENINLLMNSVTIGASGAVFGILLAFGMLFPNTLLYIYFAIPIKAKWFVVLYGAVELYSGIANSSGDNVAHFAHLGGMLFGFILIKFWQKRRNNTY
ncbi:MAG: rhomboid family intramembrane serine protease [Bacteroidota bacterium]